MDIIDRETDVTLDRATLLDYYSYATYMVSGVKYKKTNIDPPFPPVVVSVDSYATHYDEWCKHFKNTRLAAF